MFAGNSSRGDVLSRGWQRIVGTIGGVLAGMGLAVLVSGHEMLSLLVMFGCAFLALYLVRISQTMLALWITAVLAVLYGLIGQRATSPPASVVFWCWRQFSDYC